MTGWPRRLALLLVGLGWLALAHPQAQTAPVISWTHPGTNVSWFELWINGTYFENMGKPTPSGVTYEYALPALPSGTWTLAVRACYGARWCETSTAITVVKMVPAASTALNYYWVDPDGTKTTWSQCKSDTPLQDADACTLATANTSADAGHTVWLRAGTYPVSGSNAVGLGPSHSGTAESPLVFSSFPGETPILEGSSGARWGLKFTGTAYTTVRGLTFRNFTQFGELNGASHHNVVTHNTFYTDSGYAWAGIWIDELCNGGSSFTCYSTHNWLYGNVLHSAHTTSADPTCVEGADLIRIGYSDGTGDSTLQNNNNTVEGNHAYHAGHAILDSYGEQIVIKDNWFHNEPWWSSTGDGCAYGPPTGYDNAAFNGKYGHRVLQITDGNDRDSIDSIIEGNRLGFGSPNPGNNGADCLDVAAPRVIVRQNDLFGGMSTCAMFKYGWQYGGTGNGGTYTRFYNNSLYYCGKGWGSYYEFEHTPVQYTSPEYLPAIRFYVESTVGNIVKNNLVYDSRRYELSAVDWTPTPPTGTVTEQNWTTDLGSPKFTDTTITQPSSLTLPNLSLQPDSSAINISTNTGRLTQASSASNGDGTASVALAVDDARYFQDGTWGSSMARGKTMFPDWIAVGTVSNVAQVSSIDYATNTITLASPLTWANDANVWLYRNASGRIALVGAAPDYGANEYGAGTVVAPTSVAVR